MSNTAAKQHSLRCLAAFAGLGLCMLVYFFLVPTGIGDDGWFMAQTMPIKDFVTWRFNAWSSRVIIEALMLAFCRLPLTAARLLMSAAAVLAAFSIWRVFTSKTAGSAFYVCSLFLVFGAFGAELSDRYFTVLTHTGFLASTFNYLLPAACGLCCLIPLSMAAENKPFRWYHWAIFPPLAVVGCNQEQVAAILAAAYFLFVLYSFLQKKPRVLLCLICLIAAASLLFILLCPGNASRLSQETATWNQRFGEYSMLQKLDIGVSSALSYLFTAEPLIILAFGLLAYIVCRENRETLIKVISLLPLAVSVGFGLFPSALDAAFGGLGTAINSAGYTAGWLGFLCSPALASTAKFLIGCVSLASAVMSIYLAFGHCGKSVSMILTLLAGIASQAVIGFSPTLEVSGIRTAFFLMLSFAALSAALIDRLYQTSAPAGSKAAAAAHMLGILGFIVMCLPTIGL